MRPAAYFKWTICLGPPDAPLDGVALHLGLTTRNKIQWKRKAKSDAELEDMILQRLLIGGVFVSVRRDPLLGWRPTVITAPKHMRNAQELADTIASDLRKKFTLKE
jgi:hypothetical protein